MTDAGESRDLDVGDRLTARPCEVTVREVLSTVAYGWCETCKVQHVIDRSLYRAGRGPWRTEHSGSSVDPHPDTPSGGPR